MKMQNDNQPSGFFDKNTFLAIALSFAVFFLWQQYVAKKYPKVDDTKVTATNPPPPSASPSPTNAPAAATAVAVKQESNGAIPPQEQTWHYDSPHVSFDISNQGMSLKNLTLKGYFNRQKEPVSYAPFALLQTSANEAYIYNVTQVAPNEFVGEASGGGVTVKKTLKIDSEKFVIHTQVDVSSPEKKVFNVVTISSGHVYPLAKSFLLPAYEHQEFFVVDNEGEQREILDPQTAHEKIYAGAQTASFNSQYFALALRNRSDLVPTAKTTLQAETGVLEVSYTTPQPADQRRFDFDFYFGPKEISALKAVDPQLGSLVDFGFFGVIGKPLHAVLLVLHDFVHNWGVAIIILTILLRFVLLPINVYSFRSMKKMQKIQPKLQSIKERFKGDPQRMNQETMKLMKDEKANPLSGCLPALMQIPIFIAFYAMIGKSFELYQQPFALWIWDLSLKDPYFILPILAGLVMFVQQKLTPMTSVDPTQAKVLMIMPIIFSFFMLSVPSGLTLYMFVNSLFGVFQQMAFLKDKPTT